ncbi:MAG: cyclase [Chloroflexi bacterium HGW-Chloroflexi-6]|nr:MAG: cyclase [Chloroflexi bacterium HGW-Chloroflexi-6]
MNIIDSANQLLGEIGPGRMSNTVYDTAWVAMLGEVDWELSNSALEWLSSKQLPDGSWGNNSLSYYHDRLICTLTAMLALFKRGRRAYDQRQVEYGKNAIEKIVSNATSSLAADPYGATVGFELIVPTLTAEAEAIGLIPSQQGRILGRLQHQRARKLSMLSGRKISRFITVAHSSEMVGSDGMHLLDIENLQEANGSIGYSPSATAFFALKVKPGDPAALGYLNSIKRDGGVPNVAPIDVFECAWTLWNLSLTGQVNDLDLTLVQKHLKFLFDNWSDRTGVGFAANYSAHDGDDTGLVFDVLKRFGYQPSLSAMLTYEESDSFRCFALEANPSVSANIHALGALRQAGLSIEHAAVQKILRFLASRGHSNTFWADKWHISPYYATSHLIITCAGFADEFAVKAVNWMCETQKSNGSWGYYMSTTEETAYCLQALAIWEKSGGKVPKPVLERGAKWLTENMDMPYPALWIGKCLYSPDLVIRSSIISALMLTA